MLFASAKVTLCELCCPGTVVLAPRVGLHWRYRHWGAACSKDQEGGRQEAEGRDFKGPGLIVDVKEEKRRGKVGRVGRRARGRGEGKVVVSSF